MMNYNNNYYLFDHNRVHANRGDSYRWGITYDYFNTDQNILKFRWY